MKVKVAVSNRHIHLSKNDLDKLFGDNYKLKKKNNLTQIGQYSCLEHVSIETKKDKIENVRIIGPLREQTQVEISNSDALKLGITPPLRDSGDLNKSETVTIIGPKGKISAKNSTIITRRHIHMPPKIANEYGFINNDLVHVQVNGDREAILGKVIIKVDPKYVLEMHIDTDEAKALFLNNADTVEIVNLEE